MARTPRRRRLDDDFYPTWCSPPPEENARKCPCDDDPAELGASAEWCPLHDGPSDMDFDVWGDPR